MKILGLIPARGGSKGVPRKNIKSLNNKPLLEYTTSVALASDLLTTVVVSTDDDEIMSVAKTLGAQVPFQRPKELSNDTATSLSVVLHALEFYEKQGIFFDAVCLLQVTSPFRTVDFLNEAIVKFIKQDADSLVSVLEVPHEYNPHWTFEVDASGTLQIATGEQQIISRRQELPKAYHRDGSIYLTKVSVLKNQQSLYGEKISYIESPKEWYVNIDTMEDWNKASIMAQQYNI